MEELVKLKECYTRQLHLGVDGCRKYHKGCSGCLYNVDDRLFDIYAAGYRDAMVTANARFNVVDRKLKEAQGALWVG